MKNEIAAVVLFLSSLIKKNGKLKKEEIDRFSNALTKFLHDKYAGHWYPGTPTKGQAYRCIRINKFQGADPELVKACILCGLAYSDLGLPKEITLWVDPWEVCCRYGEKNHAFIVSSFESEDEDKAEISQKVSFVAGNITSDYHSGSSSDEEVYVNSKKGASVMPNTNGSCQIPEFVFQSLPAWSKIPKKKHSSQYNYHPRFASTYQHPQGNKVYGHMPWLPTIVHNERNHWTNLHIVTNCHHCLI